jgi:hypothetical protein
MLTTPRPPRSSSGCARSCRVSQGRHACGGATRDQTGRGRAWESLWGMETGTRQGELPPSAGEIPQALSTIIQEG